ncbi:MAG: L-aspartate oxidase [Eubacteriales bacterium]|nr:L-aspartate oxidase [Eubacteriales bacterium]
MNTDILIVGSGCAGLYCALKLPKDKNILIITKDRVENSDSFLAQGGICMLRDEEDYESFYEDTMRAGHYENDPKSVEVMIRSSQELIQDLVSFGVDFQREEDGSFKFTREGAHSQKRILFHEDITGKEITSKLYEQVKKCPNVTLIEKCCMVDILEEENTCYGVIARMEDGMLEPIMAKETVLATGGIGGLYRHSTNFPHLTGDALAIALKHGIELKNINYIQIHPTTLFSEKKGERSFLISESVRGEGAHLYNSKKERFVNELLPRDLLTKEILHQMEADGTDYVWEDLSVLEPRELTEHFPNIVDQCKKSGYDVSKECIPVVPAQHYFMGGIKVNLNSKTSMNQLYAIGETACNGVHGKNRLASNSLLESLVFAGRSAKDITETYAVTKKREYRPEELDFTPYLDAERLAEEYKTSILNEIERMNKAHV